MPLLERLRLPLKLTARAGRAATGATWYVATAGVEGVAQLAIIPIVTRTVDVRTFTQYILVGISCGLALMLTDLGCSGAAVRQYSLEPPARRDLVLATAFWGRAALAALYALAIFTLGPLLPWSWLDAPDVPAALPAAALTVLAWALLDGCCDALRILERHRTVALLWSLRAAAYLAAILAGAKLRGDVAGLVGAIGAGHGTALLIALPLVWPRVRRRPSAGLYRQLLRFGLPLAGAAVLRSIQALDRYLVTALSSLAQAGVYHVATMPAAAIGFVDRAGASVDPYVYGEGDAAGRALEGVVRVLGALLLAVATGLAVLGEPVLSFLAPASYAGALPAIGLVLFASASESLFRVAGLGSGLVGRTSPWAWAAGIQLAVAAALMIALIPPWGATGAAAGRCAGSLAGLLACYALSRRVGGQRLPVGTLAACLAALAGATWLLAGPLREGIGLAARVAIGAGLAAGAGWLLLSPLLARARAAAPLAPGPDLPPGV